MPNDDVLHTLQRVSVRSFLEGLDMSKVIAPVAVAIPASVQTALVAAVEAEQSNYGARKAFAASINDVAPAECKWYALEGNGQKLPPVIAAIKEAYYKGLKSINYSNPSNAWRMVKDYAKADAGNRAMFGELPPVTAQAVAEAEADGAGKGNTRETRKPQRRLLEDLTELHDYCAKQTAKNDPEFLDKHKQAHGYIVQALKAIGAQVGI